MTSPSDRAALDRTIRRAQTVWERAPETDGEKWARRMDLLMHLALRDEQRRDYTAIGDSRGVMEEASGSTLGALEFSREFYDFIRQREGSASLSGYRRGSRFAALLAVACGVIGALGGVCLGVAMAGAR